MAAELWARAREMLRAQGVRHCEVWTQEDEPANRFYCAMGFELCKEQCWLRCEASEDTCERMLHACVGGDVFGVECFVFDAPPARREELSRLCSAITEVRLFSCDL